jgi:hypothetical protein
MRLRRYLSILIVCLLATASTVARAQTVVGDGIKLGDSFLLHLGLGLELAYDSNIFFEEAAPHRSFELRLTPRFDLSNSPRVGGRQFLLDFHGGLNYLEYLNSNPAIERLRQFNVDAGVLASFFPLNPYNFQLFDNFARTAQAPYSLSDHNFDRDTNDLGVRINLAPGGGRLAFYIGYVFGVDFFEPTQLQAFNLLSHRFDFRASWKVLPKTAIYVAASETLYLYQNQNNGTNSYDHPDSYPFRVVAGIQGLITTKLTLNAYIGYGNGFYQTIKQPNATGTTTVVNANPNTPIGGVAVTWKPTMLSTGTLGYDHDFVNSLLGSYYDMDTVYLSWTQLIWRFTGFLRVSYSNERFKGITPLTGDLSSTRTDNYLTVNTRVDYPFLRWLWGSVGYDLQLNRSNATLDLGPTATVPVSYTKSVVYLRLTAWY